MRQRQLLSALPRLRACVACVCVAGISFTCMAAFAQTPPIGPGGGLSGGVPGTLPAPPGQPTKTAPKGPSTHAARGGDRQSQLPTQSAQLPEKPNEIPKSLRNILRSDFNPDADERRDRKSHHAFYGLYYSEQSGHYSFKSTFPPLWIERKKRVAGGWDRASLYGLTYYNRRSPNYDADVVFPFFWKLRDGRQHTTIVGPFMHSEGPDSHANWLAPLFFEGSKKGGSSYLHIPPLLTFHHRTPTSGFSMAGPVFCKWRGGARCDGRTADRLTMGVAPLYFYSRDQNGESELIPPLLHYYRYRERGSESLNVWGPLWMEKTRTGGVFNLLPLFWHNWEGEHESNTTLFPLFHYSRKGAARTIATPLFIDHIDEDGDKTFATFLYARHRGRTELDMFTPLVWQYRDPDINLKRTVVVPFFYRNVSNRSDDIAVFPLFARFKRHGIRTSTWITPFFRFETSLTGWEGHLYPLFHAGRENNSTHFVAAPIVWDFKSPRSRSTVVFPIFWRFSDEKSVSQLIGNTYYSEEKVRGGTEWSFHLFPLVSFGASPMGHWWSILYGLAGYERDGTFSKMKLGYIPITLSPRE